MVVGFSDGKSAGWYGSGPGPCIVRVVDVCCEVGIILDPGLVVHGGTEDGQAGWDAASACEYGKVVLVGKSVVDLEGSWEDGQVVLPLDGDGGGMMGDLVEVEAIVHGVALVEK